MFIKNLYLRYTLGFSSLILLAVAAFVSSFVPPVSSAGGDQAAEIILQTSTDSVMRLSISTNEIIYNALDQRIYASRPSTAGPDGNSLTRINPLTGELVGSVYVGSEPNLLALSDDGQTLYVTLDGAYGIRRYETLTQTPGLQFSIGRGQSVNAGDAAYRASDIAVAPGNPNILAVSRYLPGISPPGVGVAIYNNGVRLPNTGPGHSAASNFLAFSGSASTLYGGGYDEGLRTMTVDGTGVTVNPLSPTPYYVKKIKYDGGFIFDSVGHVIEPQTRQLRGTCPNVNTNAFVPDAATGRVLYAMKVPSSSNIKIVACDINTFAEIGSLIIPNVGSAEPISLIRYGTNGLAMRTYYDQLYLIQTALIPTANPLPTPTGTPATTPTPSPTVYDSFIRQVALPNRDFIYRPADGKFYVSVPSTAATPYANTVTRINPTTAAIENSVAIGNNPGRMAFTDDGQIMYIGINGDNAVKKFDMQTQASLLQFPLGNGVNGPKIAYDIDVLPGNPNAVAVSYGNTSYNYDGADIYDNGVKRAQKANASGQINIVAPDIAYVGENYIYKYSITPNGFALQGNFSTGTSSDSFVVGNLLYAGDRVIDLNTLGYTGTFTGAGYRPGIAVDVPNNRIFFLAETGISTTEWSILAYRLDNFMPVGRITLPGILISPSYPESPHRLIRWGANGLAFNDYNGKVYFLQTNMVSTEGIVPTALRLNAQTFNFSEGGGSLPVTIIRSGGSTGTTTVDYATSDATATAGSDYVATSGSVTFAPGEKSKIIEIPIINDNVHEGNETFNFVITNAAGSGTVEIQNPGSAVVTIADNDGQPYRLTASINVNEPPIAGTTTALFTVELSNPTTQTATISYATANGTATAGSDYVATSGTLTFAPLETTKTVAVQILADDLFTEPNEFFFLNFSNAVNMSNFGSSPHATIINYNPQTAPHIEFDFDGDRKSDVSVFRPSNGSWYLQQSTGGFTGVAFGLGTDVPAPADFDGDGRTDIAVFREGTWYYLRSSNGSFVATNFGQSGDLPRPGDFDGDGLADISVFRPSTGTWYRLNSSNAQFVVTPFGQDGDIPLIADFDGDGKSDAAVFRPSAGFFYRLESSTGQFRETQFGIPTDVPVPADFDGDGKTDIAVFRRSDGAWYRLNSSNGAFAAQQFGAPGDVPAPADYDGDGKADLAVFRSGTWYILQSSNGAFTGQAFGISTDKPVPAAFNR